MSPAEPLSSGKGFCARSAANVIGHRASGEGKRLPLIRGANHTQWLVLAPRRLGLISPLEELREDCRRQR